MKIIGIITYNHRHLKTEVLVRSFNLNKRISKIIIFALPFKKYKKRKALFNHRPDQNKGIHPRELSRLKKVDFREWNGKDIISDECDLFVIGGAGILKLKPFKNKKVYNAHPGIIPTTRGLDSFKWAVFSGDQLGITIHEISNKVDKGNIKKIIKTPVYKSDNIIRLAKRHYDLEINELSKILNINKKNIKVKFIEKQPTMRMPYIYEKQMINNFKSWKKKNLTTNKSK